MADAELIERLVTELDADISKLNDKFNKAIKASYDTASRIEKSWQGLLDKPLGDAGKAVDNLFSSGRMQVLGAASSQIGGLSGALGQMGVAGLAAAAAIAAVGAAAAKAVGFANWALQLQTTAKTLGLTTTQLQEFDYVATATGIPVEQMRALLGGLATVIGQVQDNFGRIKIPKTIFAAIFGDSPDQAAQQLRQLGDIEHILPVILDYASRLSATQLAGMAQGLHVSPEVLSSLVDARDKVSDLIAEAHKFGIVFDEDVVRKGAEAADKLRAASGVIDANMKSAFEDLLPAIVAVANAIADATRLLNQFIESFKALPDQNTGALQTERTALVGENARFQEVYGQNMSGSPAAALRYSQNQSRIGQIDSTLGERTLKQGINDEILHPSNNTGNSALAPNARRKPRKGDAASLSKEVKDRLDQAVKDRLAAELALTSDVMAHADAEKAAVAAEFNKQADDIAAQLAKVAADKSLTDAQKRHLAAELQSAEASEYIAASLKDQKIDQDALAKSDADAIAFKEEINSSYSQLADIQAGLAANATQRYQIERDNLLANQGLARESLRSKTRSAVAAASSPEDATIAQGQGDEQMNALLSVQGAQRQQLAKQNQGPLGNYADQLEAATDPSTAYADIAVKALQNLNQGLDDAITKGKSLSDVFTNVFRTIEESLVNLAIEKYLTLPLAQALGLSSMGGVGQPNPVASGTGGGIGGFLGLFTSIGKFFTGFAGGTLSAPGGLALVGESGPELVNLPAGSGVMSNRSLMSVTNPASLKPAAVTQVLQFDLSGAVMTSDLLGQMSAMANQAKIQGAALGAQAARQVVPAEMARRQALVLR